MSGLTMEHFRETQRLVDSIPASPLFGYKIIESEFIGKPVTQFRWRTWRERLFTLPWQPMRKMAFYTVYKPNGELIVDNINKMIYGHPVDIYNLKTHLDNAQQEGE